MITSVSLPVQRSSEVLVGMYKHLLVYEAQMLHHGKHHSRGSCLLNDSGNKGEFAEIPINVHDRGNGLKNKFINILFHNLWKKQTSKNDQHVIKMSLRTNPKCQSCANSKNKNY